MQISQRAWYHTNSTGAASICILYHMHAHSEIRKGLGVCVDGVQYITIYLQENLRSPASLPHAGKAGSVLLPRSSGVELASKQAHSLTSAAGLLRPAGWIRSRSKDSPDVPVLGARVLCMSSTRACRRERAPSAVSTCKHDPCQGWLGDCLETCTGLTLAAGSEQSRPSP